MNLGILDYAYRLVPGNPIFLRVVETSSKRTRDLIIRCAYLGLLVLVVIFSLTESGSNYASAGLADLAKESAAIFAEMSYLQLILVTLLAPIFTAGAITQERDSQTYDILLTTPLTNGQIVLGSLMSRLYFVLALLVSGIPIFAITQIFGGVSIGSIVISFLIAAATAIVTGAMAMAIASFKVGTRRTIFSFAMFLGFFLGGTLLLDQTSVFKITLTDSSGAATASTTSWLTSLNPFLALRATLGQRDYQPPPVAALPATLRAWPLDIYWTEPAAFYIAAMSLLSVVLVVPAIVVLRRMAQSSVTIKSFVLAKLHIGGLAGRTRKPRSVWMNPIAWREARTRGSAVRGSAVRWAFILLGIGGAIALVVMHSTLGQATQYILPGDYDAARQTLSIEGKDAAALHIDPDNTVVKLGDDQVPLSLLNERFALDSPPATAMTMDPATHEQTLTATSITLKQFPRALSADDARRWLLGMVLLEFSIMLLIVANAAASTVTREKEDGTLDLLLTTPITSRYYIWGKLRGLVAFVLPLMAAPLAAVAIFVVHDLSRWIGGDAHFDWVVNPEALLALPATLIIFCALSAILGMQMSLRLRTTVRAVMVTVGILAAACAGMGWCGSAIVSSGSGDNPIGDAFACFSPFTLVSMLVSPQLLEGNAPGADSGTRILIAVMAWLSAGAYGAVVWILYNAMVKNFDMTIRRQSR